MKQETPEPLTLDAARAVDLLYRGLDVAATTEMNDRLQAILADFTEEQQAGYETLVRDWRAWTLSHTRREEIEQTLRIADEIRRQFEVFVLVGIGGSDLGGRTLHDTLDHPFYNQLSPDARGGAPELYFTGDTFDPKRLLALLDLLDGRGLLPKTCINVVSKSGTTGETIAAAMVIRERMQQAGIQDWSRQVVATTGQNAKSVLFQMNEQTPFLGMLPVPEGVGGRFSFASPVGLLPFAVTAAGPGPHARLEEALHGYAEAHRRFLLPADDSHNTACRLARVWHLAEAYAGMTDLVFCNYADDARLADWFTQLYSESIQERAGGLNIIGTRGPTGNHSLLNGILRGPRDKVVMLIRWQDMGPDARIPTDTGIQGDLQSFEGLPLSAVQAASCQGTAEDFLANGVPTMTLTIARRDPYHLFLLMRTLMDAVAIKGRLQDLHIDTLGRPNPAEDLTYRQDGVEGYKVRTRVIAAGMQPKGRSASRP